ncbi:MAG: alanine--tRNA ligase [Anaerolineae bacterium]
MSMTGTEIRQCFLDFFASKGHAIVPSASLVPGDDPTLLFTNAGMNQFKNIFLGLEKREYRRAADSQKCLRVSGKHNDLEDVGYDTYHHTFFEMLGNWSFGDYYKKEAIAWAWELLTEVWGLPKDRLWATVFKDEKGELETDEEAARYWAQVTDIIPEHILYFGRKDNFWEMGDTGPCGPCSEIHLDRGEEACDCRDDPNHVCGVNGDCRRFFELWNLVFIQYNKDNRGTLYELPAKHVDTGMGFERLVSVLQGVVSNYDTDLFAPVMARIQEMLGHSDAEREADIVGYRVIADHGRAVTFLVGDGVLPGNEGRNYVLRMILRRAARFGRKIGFTGPFLGEIAKVVIETMGPYFTELEARREFILQTITQEEERFQRTLDVGLTLLDELVAELSQQGEAVIPGDQAFRLYDTYGFPLDLTRDVAKERGLTVDEAGFAAALEKQRELARAAQQFAFEEGKELEVYSDLLDELKRAGRLPEAGVEHVYGERTGAKAKVAAIVRAGQVVASAREGDEVELVLTATPFYVESGGQVSDTGRIVQDGEGEPGWEVAVSDVRQPLPGLIVHIGEVRLGTPQVGDSAQAVVDSERRMDIARNHTATHLLHNALRCVLGEHVQQAGSLVGPGGLRFDFTHSAMLTQDELSEVERLVNEAILANYPVEVIHSGYKEAIAEGAIALFGEKYSERVRVLKIGDPSEPFSQELCGGTHVKRTSEIGSFHIASESSIGAGLRRIEAFTGRAAQKLVQERMRVLESSAAFLSCSPDEVDRKLLALLDELQERSKEVASLRREIAHRDFEGLLSRVQDVGGVKVLAAQVEVADMDTLREMSDWFRNRMGSGVIVLGAVMASKPSFVAAITSDLVERGLHAGQLVKQVAQVVGGSGGGKPTLAQAGGRDTGRIGEALRLVPDLVAEGLS